MLPVGGFAGVCYFRFLVRDSLDMLRKIGNGRVSIIDYFVRIV